MIIGQKVVRPTKEDLSADIADYLGVAVPYVSRGGSVDSNFLDLVQVALTGSPTGGTDTYRKIEAVLDGLGLTYDPYWDTSEAAQAGGGTVTARAFSRIRTALTGAPRCFIVNVNDSSTGTRWEVNHQQVYRYDDTVSGRMALNDAGPGSRFVYYSTSSARRNPRHFVAAATVAYIGPDRNGPWEVRLEDYEDFATPVPVLNNFEMEGWNPQVSITEIAFSTYQQILVAGGNPANRTGPVATAPGKDEPESEVEDVSGQDVAERVLEDFPVAGLSVAVAVPLVLPAGALVSEALRQPSYTETDDGKVEPEDQNSLPARSRNKRRDKLAEVRAVAIATKALGADGWTLSRDRQTDGVGYDLEFTKNSATLHVEVKGVQGPRLTFNVTPKEFWRAKTDERWVLVAVTSVLSPRDPQVHLVTRDRIVAAQRVVTGYRISV